MLLLWTKVVWASSRSQEGKVQNSYICIFFLLRNIESFYLIQRLPLIWRCVMIFTEGHLGKFKVTKMKSAKFMSDSSFWKYWKHWKHWKFLLHKTIAFHPRLFHGYAPGNLGKLKVIERKGLWFFSLYIFLMEICWKFRLSIKLPITWHVKYYSK